MPQFTELAQCLKCQDHGINDSGNSFRKQFETVINKNLLLFYEEYMIMKKLK